MLKTDDPGQPDFARAMDDLTAPACVIDRDGRFSWLNRAHIELFGDLRGQPFTDNVAPEHRQLARTNFAIPQASAPEKSVLDELTPRQQEVLRLLAEGLETPEIARRLGVAEETARNHIRALLRATRAHSRLGAVLIGLRPSAVEPQLTQPGQQVPPPSADD